MTRARSMLALVGALLGGCVVDVPIAIELRPPRDADGGPAVPSEVVSHELRLYRIEEGGECPPLALAATAAPFGELGHAQVFDAADGMGMAIGEVPPGYWAVAALSRDASCAVRLYGCAELTLGLTAPATFVVTLDAVNEDAGCGACRACESGACAPVAATCP